MTTITIAIHNSEDKQLVLSLARRLNLKIVRVKEERPSKTDDIRQSLTRQFEEDCAKYASLVSKPETAKIFFKNTIEQLPEEELQQLIFSLTDSESIYFRFPLSHVPSTEVHLEVFYIQTAEEDDIEAVVTIYQKNQIIVKDYGKLSKALKIINGARLPAQA